MEGVRSSSASECYWKYQFGLVRCDTSERCISVLPSYVHWKTREKINPGAVRYQNPHCGLEIQAPTKINQAFWRNG
jgi:hypothetical protein